MQSNKNVPTLKKHLQCVHKDEMSESIMVDKSTQGKHGSKNLKTVINNVMQNKDFKQGEYRRDHFQVCTNICR